MPTATVKNDSAVTRDPLLSFLFALVVEGKLTGYFTHLGGLGSETEVIDHKVVNEDGIQIIMKLPGRLTWNPITLKRGITDNYDIWTWRQEVVDGNIAKARTNASIIALDQTMTEVARWELEKAWPSKVSGPEFDSASGAVVFEEVTIVFESMKRVK